MLHTRFLTPARLSPAAAVHVWLAIFAASLGPPIALAMPMARDFAGAKSIAWVLGVLSASAMTVLVRVAMSQKTPRAAVISSLVAIPLSIVVCAMGGGVADGPAGFILGGVFGIVFASPVGVFFGTVVAPLLHLAKRAELSGALVLRDRVHAVAATYASVGSVLGILFGAPVWFAVPAIVSFGFAAERLWHARARSRFIAQITANELPAYVILENELTEMDSRVLPCLADGPLLHVLFLRNENSSPVGAYRSAPTLRPLLRLP